MVRVLLPGVCRGAAGSRPADRRRSGAARFERTAAGLDAIPDRAAAALRPAEPADQVQFHAIRHAQDTPVARPAGAGRRPQHRSHDCDGNAVRHLGAEFLLVVGVLGHRDEPGVLRGAGDLCGVGDLARLPPAAQHSTRPNPALRRGGRPARLDPGRDAGADGARIPRMAAAVRQPPDHRRDPADVCGCAGLSCAAAGGVAQTARSPPFEPTSEAGEPPAESQAEDPRVGKERADRVRRSEAGGIGE